MDRRTERAFEALEHRADGGFDRVALRLVGSEDQGWELFREDRAFLELGPGYRLLRSQACGVCATDLARRFLPFPLPQVLGHEVLARDEAGRRLVVEINASHAARGIPHACPFCAQGLATHCPERLVLGIHDLPGGFGPFFLAPRAAILPVPDDLPDEAALLVEPFAAALHGVETLAPRAGERVAVLGPGRLGCLTLCALDAWQRREGVRIEVLALGRSEHSLARARACGARAQTVPPTVSAPLADCVIDTSGCPEGLELALALADREVHLESTHGRPAGGLANPTAFVVDELRLAPLGEGEELREGLALEDGARPAVAWLAAAEPPPAWQAAELCRGNDAAALLAGYEARPSPSGLPRADAIVVDGMGQADSALRPRAGSEASLVRPRGTIFIEGASHQRALSSSRCGSFARALELMAGDAILVERLVSLVTHRLPVAELPRAFALAASPEALKVVLEHDAQRPDSSSPEGGSACQS